MEVTNGVAWDRYGFRLEACKASVRNGENVSNPFRTIYINDLNPSVKIVTCMTKWEMVRVGFWFIKNAFFPNPYRKDAPE